MRPKKTLSKILDGAYVLPFKDLVSLSEGLGFTLERVRGSHHIFSHPEVAELLNLQEVKGEAKPYQVRQLMKLIEKYDLTLEDGA